MRVTVKVVPNARKDEVRQEDGRLKVRVTAPPVDGKANAAVVLVLAKHFKVKRGAVRLVRGETSREKVFEVDT